jgi:hypothetical protein
MSRTTQQMREMADLLIAMEASQAGFPTTGTPAAFQVCEKLRPHLTPLMGATGFHALLSRALTLARAEVPRLASVQVNADGSLARPKEPAPLLNPEELAEGGHAIVAQLLSLLEAFVGERLTLRMLRTVWPKLPRRD